MSELGFLNLTITIKADEEQLREIESKFNNAETPELANKLQTTIKEILSNAGVEDDLEVDCQCGQVGRHYGGGGLSAGEWLGTKK